jgi:hypothetical protein
VWLTCLSTSCTCQIFSARLCVSICIILFEITCCCSLFPLYGQYNSHFFVDHKFSLYRLALFYDGSRSAIRTIVCTCELVISLSLVRNMQDCWVYLCSEGLSFVVILQVDWYSLHFLVFIGIRIEVQPWTRLSALGRKHFKNWEYFCWLNFTLVRNFVADS